MYSIKKSANVLKTQKFQVNIRSWNLLHRRGF